jgi:hypothetical protein
MKLKLDENGKPIFVVTGEKVTCTMIDHDDSEKQINPIDFVKNARSAGSQAQALRAELKTAETALKAYELEDGVMLDPELAAAAIKRGDKHKDDKEGLAAQLQATKEAYEKKLTDAISPLNETITGLKGERTKAALLGSKDLQGTIFFRLGEKHLMAEFGSLIDADGNPVDRSGKPIMSDADPSKPATVTEAAPLWLSTHPDGKDKIMIDTFSGGAGGSGGKGGSGDTENGGYAGIVAEAKK